MNRIEARLNKVKEENKKAFITYMTAGLPDMEGMKHIVRALEEAETDVLELGIPFSDPVADGPVIQAASYRAICQGVNLSSVFDAVKEMRTEGISIPIVFMMYYNTILHYGVEQFVRTCEETGVDGLIIPDLPFEEQSEIGQYLDKETSPILIQLVSPVSAGRIPMLLEGARGFVYCVSAMGVTGQAADFHKEVVQYLSGVKAVSKIPVMMGFGIREAADVEPMKEMIDGCIVGSHFIKIMEESNYSAKAAKEYAEKFRQELNR